MADGYISSMISASEVGQADLMEVSVVDSTSSTGYSTKKMTVSQLGGAIVEDVEYTTELETDSKTISGAINELNAGIAEEDGTITVSDTSVTTLNARSYLVKVGKMIYMNFTFSTSASTGTTIATLPEGFLPIHRMDFGTFNESSSSSSHTQTLPIQIRVDGAIRTIQIAPTSGDTYSGFAVWTTD